MAFLFGSPPTPPPPPPPPPHPATMAKDSIQLAGQQAALAAAAQSGAGFSDTLKTSSLGAPAPQTAKTELLGGG